MDRSLRYLATRFPAAKAWQIPATGRKPSELARKLVGTRISLADALNVPGTDLNVSVLSEDHRQLAIGPMNTMARVTPALTNGIPRAARNREAPP